MRVTEGQNIFDICLQGYGQLDELIRDVLIPNGLTFDSVLHGGMDLTIETTNKGNGSIKELIKREGLVFMNRNIENEYVVSLANLQWPTYVLGNVILNKNKIVL